MDGSSCFALMTGGSPKGLRWAGGAELATKSGSGLQVSCSSASSRLLSKTFVFAGGSAVVIGGADGEEMAMQSIFQGRFVGVWNSRQISLTAASVMHLFWETINPLHEFVFRVWLSNLFWMDRAMTSLIEWHKATQWGTVDRADDSLLSTALVTTAATILSCCGGMLKEVLVEGNQKPCRTFGTTHHHLSRSEQFGTALWTLNVSSCKLKSFTVTQMF